MKKIACMLLIISMMGFTFPTNSGTLQRGAVEIQLNNEPAGALSNPTSHSVELDRRCIDSLTGEHVEGTITLPPLSGKILLIEPSLQVAALYFLSKNRKFLYSDPQPKQSCISN